MSAERVAVVGGGTIGLSWAALFAAKGRAVRVSDPRPDLKEALARAAAGASPDLATAPEAILARIETGSDAAWAADGAAFVQEAAPEDLGLKQELFARLETAAPEGALLLSSTSSFPPSALAAKMKAPGRLLVGHPFHPAHLIPLVELVPGKATPPEALARAEAFYRSLGKTVAVVRAEIPGFVANRLQAAIFAECVRLVRDGVVGMDALDDIVTESLGVRWAAAGPFRAFHLGGGAEGLRGHLKRFGPALSAGWKTMTAAPELTPELVESLSSQADASFGKDAAAGRLVAERIRAVLAARRPS